jgi:phosphotriesterase-related protein
VRIGIIGEIGVSWPPTVDERKSLHAAALAQQQTGLAILLHPGRHEVAPRAHLDDLIAAGADPTRVIVSHIDRTLFDVDDMQRLAEETGAVLEFDLFGDESSYYPPNPAIDRPNDGTRVRWIAELVRRGLVDHIAISQDICRKTRLTAWGGEGYSHILRRVRPLMAARGVTAEAIEIITRIRPAELLSRPVTETP